jgi:hypothetical protein
MIIGLVFNKYSQKISTIKMLHILKIITPSLVPTLIHMIYILITILRYGEFDLHRYKVLFIDTSFRILDLSSFIGGFLQLMDIKKRNEKNKN